MIDETESTRRAMLASGQPAADAAQAVDLMTTDEMSAQYTVLAFLAPFAVVRRKSDGKCGSLEFTHSPRRYFNWQPDDQGA
jgi:hypothetical protein